MLQLGSVMAAAHTAAPVPAEPRVEQRDGGRAGGEEGRAVVDRVATEIGRKLIKSWTRTGAQNICISVRL